MKNKKIRIDKLCSRIRTCVTRDSIYDTTRGESALWSAVITQAMIDALSKAKGNEAYTLKLNAVRWLTGNSDDFITVCLLAGMDPDNVRMKAKKAIANPVPWRAAPGKGKRYQKRRAWRIKQQTQSPATNQQEMEYA